MATFANNQKSGNSTETRGGEMARPRSKFLPSIFEEKQDEKIQEFRKTLQINDDEEEHMKGTVRSGIYDGESVDEKILQDQQNPRLRVSTAKLKTPVRSSSESRLDQNSWRSKRRHSAFAGGNRLNSSILGGNKSFGYGQRKITSPGVNRGRAVDMPEVIDFTNQEDVKNIAKRFFEEELQMDLSDPRLNKPEDFIASLRWKAESKFSYGELWHRPRNSLQSTASVSDSSEMFQSTASSLDRKQAPIEKTNRNNFHDKLRPFPQLKSKYFQVCYSKPKTIGDANNMKKKLTTSLIKQQADYGYRRKRYRILNPIRQDEKKSDNILKAKSTDRNQNSGRETSGWK